MGGFHDTVEGKTKIATWKALEQRVRGASGYHHHLTPCQAERISVTASIGGWPGKLAGSRPRNSSAGFWLDGMPLAWHGLQPACGREQHRSGCAMVVGGLVENPLTEDMCNRI